jgi:hypothetical protein
VIFYDNFGSVIKKIIIEVDISTSDAVLGHPALTKFMAIPHYPYMVLKMPVPRGALTMQANFAIAYACEKESLTLAEAVNLSARMDASLTESKKVPKTKQEIPMMEALCQANKAKEKEVSLSLANPSNTMKIRALLDPK